MTHFPNEVFTTIVSYCDDRIEQKQRALMGLVAEDIQILLEESWLFGNMTDDEAGVYDWNFEDYTTVKFKFTERALVYNEIGIGWLIRHLHPNDTTIWKEWDYYG